MGLPGGHVVRDPHGGRSKKLIAGIRVSLWFADAGKPWDCSDCTERQRDQRNCHNKRGVQVTIREGAEEWKQAIPGVKEICKIDRTKFYSCPVSEIWPQTWEMLRLVNACLSSETGDICCLPLAGGWLDQPRWFHQAVEIVRAERGRHRAEKMDKLKR